MNNPTPDDEFSIQRTLGRIEQALVTMADDLHEAVVAQKALTERLEQDEKRLAKVEDWRDRIASRNSLVTKVVLILLIPTITWTYTTGKYLLGLAYRFETQQSLPHRLPKP